MANRGKAKRGKSYNLPYRLFPLPSIMSPSITLDIPDLAATNAFGHRLAGLLFSGSVIALVGPLGAGKTHLVRAIADGLGIADSRRVNSPTFVLIQEYQARMPIFHFDAYRLRNTAEFIDLGPHEYFEANGVCLIEWADKVAACLPKDYLIITIEVTGENSRCFLLEGIGEKYEGMVRQLQKWEEA